MVERQQSGLELGRPVEVEQPAPQLTRRLRASARPPRRRSPCPTTTRAPTPAARGRSRSPPARRRARAVRSRFAVCGPHGLRRSRRPSHHALDRAEEPRPLGEHLLVERRERRAASSTSTRRKVPRGSNGCANAVCSRASLISPRPRGEPVAEARIDRRLRRPQVRRGLAACAAVRELIAHQRGEHAAAPMRRQNADDALLRQSGTVPPPGTDIRYVNAPVPPTIRSPSQAACMRSTSRRSVNRSALLERRCRGRSSGRSRSGRRALPRPSGTAGPRCSCA